MIDILQGYRIHTIIGFALVVSMIINAINVCFWETHIFEKIGDYVERKFPRLYKPTIGCIICMTPWWGTLLCYVFGWPYLSIVIAMGINVLIVRWEPEKKA